MIFVLPDEAFEMPARFWDAMPCAHDGFHGVRSRYDQRRGVLVYFWTCERCGVRLGEVRRQAYRPRFDPRGNERQRDAA
jgi:hypothetical protein